MKKNFQISFISLLVALLVLMVPHHGSAADDLTGHLQKGLLEEEVNRNYGEALKAYQAAITTYDTNRQAAATAVFRLAETYRKLGKTNEARVQYERVINEFVDQVALVMAAGKQLQSDKSIAGSNPNGSRSGYAYTELRVLEAQLAWLKTLKVEQLPLALNQVEFSDTLNLLLRNRIDISFKLMTTLKEVAPEHPDAQKLKSLLADIEKRLMEEAKISIQRLETKVKVLREIVGRDSDASLPQAAAKRMVNTAGNGIPEEEQAEIERLQAMLKNSPDLINSRSVPGYRTPLHIAASKGQIQVVRFLLTNQANINLRADQGYTALHFAAEYGHKTMVELLLDNGMDVNIKTSGVGSNERTALQLAASKGFSSVVETLLARGASVTELDDNGKSALNFAINNEDAGLVRLLLTQLAKVDGITKLPGKDLLHAAANSGNAKLIELLLAYGPEIDARDVDGRTPLHIAVSRGHLAATLLLLKHQADPNISAIKGYGTLAATDRADIAEALLAAGAKVNAEDEGGRTALFGAVVKKKKDMLKLLLQHGADPNTAAKGFTPLMQAIIANQTEIARMLLDAKADPNRASFHSTTYGACTPLQMAVGSRAAEMVELLLMHKADTAAIDRRGRTVLHYAVANADVAMVELLLKYKADASQNDEDGVAPLTMAQQGWNRNLFNEGLTSSPVPRPGLPTIKPDWSVPWSNLALISEVTKVSPSFQQIIKLLVDHGADPHQSRRAYIAVSRLAKQTCYVVFSKDKNGVNRYSLNELLAAVYQHRQTGHSMAFPDFTRIVVNRLDGKQTKEIRVNLASVLESGDGGTNMWLEWGDIVELPEADHNLSEQWDGLKQTIRNNLSKSNQRQVTLKVKGNSYGLSLAPALFMAGPVEAEMALRQASLTSGVITNLSSLWLSKTVFTTKALLSSSDTKRVKVTRKVPGTGETKEMIYDIGTVQSTPDDLWLRDGDVIEVPEKE